MTSFLNFRKNFHDEHEAKKELSQFFMNQDVFKMVNFLEKNVVKAVS